MGHVSRRHFIQTSALATAAMGLDPWSLLRASDDSGADHLLSRLAYRTTTTEGEWTLRDIEGALPTDLQGELVRVGPGVKKSFGKPLNHFFDGDAYVNRYRFDQGTITLKAKFIDTSERQQERAAGRMIYDEFGTEAPKRTRKLKNQPNVNVIKWRDGFLSLSEGGNPSFMKGDDMDFVAYHRFSGTLKRNIGFSAHPKRDPQTGRLYGFGIEQSMSKALVIFEMDEKENRLKELYKLRQKHVFMIHDMAMTENYLVFLIPPAYFKLSNIILDRGSMAQALRFDENMGSRLIVCRKDGRGRPLELKAPAKLIFHHANAFEREGKLHLYSCVANDASLLDHIGHWQRDSRSAVQVSNLTEFVFDLANRKLESEEVLALGHDFPSLNRNVTGREQRYFYATHMGPQHDIMAFAGVSKFDRETRKLQTYAAEGEQMMGESVFVPAQGAQSEDHGYLFVPGYDHRREESFLDILDARRWQRQARIWCGRYLPLGFHGNFYPFK